MTFILDFLPLVAFFVAYKVYGMKIAVAVLMAATVVQVAGYRLLGKKVAKHLLVSALAVLAFGALTLSLDDPLFIMLKPTIVFCVLALGLGVALALGKNPIAALASEMLPVVPDRTWRNLGWQWVAMFLLLGMLNLALVNLVSESMWVNAKVFGFPLLTTILAITQVSILYRRHGQDIGKQKDDKQSIKPAN